MDSTSNNEVMDNNPILPYGYVAVIGPENQQYVVPEFMVPALHLVFDGYRLKRDLEVSRQSGSVHEFNGTEFDVIGEGKIMAPAVPGSSDRERLSAHAEVLALQDRLGISYKDASHRLYMAELEKAKSDEKMHKAFVNLQVSTEQALERANKSIREMKKPEV